VIVAQWKSACPSKIRIYSLATEICYKLVLEIFDLNDFFFFTQALKEKKKFQSVWNSPRART